MKKEGYFKRLKSHPGLGAATLLSIFMFAAAATNKNIHSALGVLIISGCGCLVIWSFVLISNFKK